MKLFVKIGCQRCSYIKDMFDLEALDVEVIVLTKEDYNALAELAWIEGVATAETSLPILVVSDTEIITGAINIRKYLEATHERQKSMQD